MLPVPEIVHRSCRLSFHALSFLTFAIKLPSMGNQSVGIQTECMDPG